MIIAKQKILERAKVFNTPPVIEGVYFLINKRNEIIYIGSSTDCYKRINTHRKNKRMRFDRQYIIKRKDKRKRLILETEYIKLYKPRFNRTDNPDYHRGKKVLWFTYLQKDCTYNDIAKLIGSSPNTAINIILGTRKTKDELYYKVYDAVMNYKNKPSS